MRSKNRVRKIGLTLCGGLLAGAALAPAREDHAPDAHASAGLAVPSSLRAEHEQLHVALARLVRSGGATGEAARAVEKALAPHFEAEEQFAMPPLGLLADLAQGKQVDPGESARAVAMADRLRREYPKMIQEHRAVGAALERLKEAAGRENKPSGVEFARTLLLHAQNEEQVLYPAAILLGEYLRLRRPA